MPNNNKAVISFLIKQKGGRLIRTSDTGSQYYLVQGRKIRVSDHGGKYEDKQICIDTNDENCIAEMRKALNPVTRKLT